MKKHSKRTILSNESGQGLTEYLILLILISVGSIAVVTQIGGAIDNRFKAAKEKIQSMSVNRDRSR
jgi:Flp pilus assembly pilin Flp